MNNQREKFEEWITWIYEFTWGKIPDFEKHDGSGDFYENAEVQNAWSSWQAALESVQQPDQVAEPVAWMTEDGRVATSETRNTAMASSSVKNFNIPLYTAPIAAVPEGYVIVPVVPTYAMLDEGGRRLQENIPAKSELEFQADAHTAWDGMLAAAPKQGD